MTRPPASTHFGALRRDLLLIADMIEPRARVLDVGCGEGDLLHHLAHTKQVDARGIELSQAGVNRSVAQGLAVVQGDADKDLEDYPENAFDFAILSQTLQATRRPRHVLSELLRIGSRAVVSFPNFGHWRVRWHLLANGRMPLTSSLPEPWYETPNIHLCTIRDFVQLCEAMEIAIERGIILDRAGTSRLMRNRLRHANLFGEQAIFLLRRR